MNTGVAKMPTTLRRCQTRADVVRLLQQRAADLHALGVRRIGLFGSFRHDTARSDSDVDLLIEFEPGQKTFDHFMALSFYLEELLQRPVELVTRESLSPHVGPHILRDVEYVPLAA